MTAGEERRDIFATGCSSPLETAKITPLTIIGTDGPGRSREIQPGTSDKLPFASLNCHAATAPLLTGPFVAVNCASVPTAPDTGANIQRRPPTSWKVASAPEMIFASPVIAGVIESG